MTKSKITVKELKELLNTLKDEEVIELNIYHDGDGAEVVTESGLEILDLFLD